MNKQQAEHLEELAQILESGKYKQGKDYLKNKDAYCCLGVAIEEYLKKFPEEGSWVEGNHGIFIFNLKNPTCKLVNLSNIRIYYGFPYTTGFVIDDHSLANHNDGLGTPAKSFTEIAALIRKYIKERYKDGN